MLNETSNGFQFSVSGHNSASFQWEEHLIVHRLLIKSSADIPKWPGVTRALFVKTSVLYGRGHWQVTTNKGLARYERYFKLISIKNQICNCFNKLWTVPLSTIEVRKTSLSCFCNTFLRSVWTLKRRELLERILELTKMLGACISIFTLYNSQSCCLKFCLT